MLATSRLKRLVEIHDMTYKDLANKANVPYATVKSVMSRGIENSSVELAIRICHALGITLNELFEENSEKETAMFFSCLNEDGTKKAKEYVADLLEIKKYRK